MKWYSYFNKVGEENLINEEIVEDENLLVCQQLKYRRYTKFRNFAEFSKYFHSCQEKEKCFYEMMRENQGRKPYFDIDIDDPAFDYMPMLEEIKKILVDMISKKIRILIFDSSTESKKSFHIIVDGFYLQTYKELLAFFDSVKEKTSESYKQFLDRSVYKSVQQFRIVGSHKFMKTNTKILREDLSYKFKILKSLKTEIAKFNYMLASSLVTNTSSCEVIYGFQPKVEEKEWNISGSAQESAIEDVMKIFYEKYSPRGFNFHECKEKNGNLLIVLRRINSTFCELCNREHENENPYITVSGEYRNITLYCRRKEEGENKLGIGLGYLGIPIYPTLEEITPTIIENLEKIEVSDVEEEAEIPEDLEDILEDIAETPKFSTPKRKINTGKSLKSVKLGGLIY